MINLNDYKGRNVLVTGSAGFVGRHLVKRLRGLGAVVHGFDVESRLDADVRIPISIRGSVLDFKPDHVFNLAAQAFVPGGYADPLNTWETNVQGTVNVLDALRVLNRSCACVVVTTDKVYGDTGAGSDLYPLLADEKSHLRGLCPYSASKVAAERVVESYRESFWKQGPVRVATARAGNIIGPGDHFGVGRLIPNAVEALRAGRPVPVYNPTAVRPWQYVGDVVDGYLRLGLALAGDSELWGPPPNPFASAFNFGPEEHHTVQEVVDEVIKAWGTGTSALVSSPLREVQHLRIDSSKARRMLGWAQGYSFEEGIRETIEAYKREDREIKELAP